MRTAEMVYLVDAWQFVKWAACEANGDVNERRQAAPVGPIQLHIKQQTKVGTRVRQHLARQ